MMLRGVETQKKQTQHDGNAKPDEEHQKGCYFESSQCELGRQAVHGILIGLNQHATEAQAIAPLG